MIDCGKPDVPDGAELLPNASNNGDNLFTVGSEIRIKCKAGHKRTNGSEKVSCASTGKWDAAFPECKCECDNYLLYLLLFLSLCMTQEFKYELVPEQMNCEEQRVNLFAIRSLILPEKGLSRVFACPAHTHTHIGTDVRRSSSAG